MFFVAAFFVIQILLHERSFEYHVVGRSCFFPTTVCFYGLREWMRSFRTLSSHPSKAPMRESGLVQQDFKIVTEDAFKWKWFST